MRKSKLKIIVSVFVFLFSFSNAIAGTISSPNSYAWSDQVGYINFSNVTVTSSLLSGYAWSKNNGWINISPSMGGVTQNGEGNLSGSAWGEGLGWINFDNVSINTSNGRFSGTATGPLVGTLTFDCLYCTVITDWRPPQSPPNAGVVQPKTTAFTKPTNPSSFYAVPSSHDITLHWENPSDNAFATVRLYRSTTGYPFDQHSGDLIYEGQGTSFIDNSTVPHQRYFYTLFTKDLGGNFSSGTVTSSELLPTRIPPHKNTIISEKDILTPDTQIIPSGFFFSLSHFNFFEKRETENQIFPKKDILTINSNITLRLTVAEKKLPKETSSLILTIHNLGGEGVDTSYLLSLNAKKDMREALIDFKGMRGRFDVTFDFYDEVQHVFGRVPAVFNLEPNPEALATTRNVDTPLTEKLMKLFVALGLISGLLRSIILNTEITSFHDLYLVFVRFVGIVVGFFRRKKREPWGVVYDSVTKQPIDPAYVILSDTTGLTSSKAAITDLDGRYGFFVEPGTYSITANKTHYQFPSTIMRNRINDEIYDNLYFGTKFVSDANSVIRYNIPLDPLEFDWNEFTKNKEHLFNLYSRKEKIRLFIFNSLFVIGFGVSIFALVFTPSFLNYSLFAFYLSILIFQTFWQYHHKVNRLIDREGKPISFAIISVQISGLSIPVTKKVLSDIMGRFYLLTQPGVYDIKVQEKQSDGTYKEVYSRMNVELPKGVLTKDIIVD